MPVDLKYIPLDKSWLIRMGILDIINGYDDIEKFLTDKEDLNDDLIALKKVSQTWNSNNPIDVGESATLYRFLRFASWKMGLNKKFILQGTLKERKITDNPEIISLSQEELLKLDNNTSQWASATVLLGDFERLENPPFKLKLTYEAISEWNKARLDGKVWPVRYDNTILKQAEAYLNLLSEKRINFSPEQAEDFCFAYVFGFMDEKEGESKWPSLRGHESDRVLEIKKEFEKAKKGEDIDSKDHRVIQALAMWAMINKPDIKFTYPISVNKSWPQFWQFLKYYSF
jgi:hypothetical protein